MTAPARERPHGVAETYRRGCRCARCRYAADAARRACRPLVEPEPIREHVRMLSSAGIGGRRLAVLARVSTRTLTRVLYEGKRVHAATAERILAVRPDSEPALRGVPATGTVRRLRALRAAGRPNQAVAAEIGVGWNCLSQVALGNRPMVRRSTAAAVAAVYRTLADVRPPATALAAVTAERARAASWFPSGAWDLDTIDDPSTLPCLLPPVEAVDRDLELLVQHLVAGHPVDPTPEARLEIVRRMPGSPRETVAAAARCSTRHVSLLRTQLAAA